jgi:16S rRNA (uracil1498-N3)-methyltransferase
MRIPRLYASPPLVPGTEIVPDPESDHYLRHVLRLSADDRVILFDGVGHEHDAQIHSGPKGQTYFVVGAAREPVERESALRIWLYLSLTRGRKMDWVVEKATELGVAGIQPVITRRSVMAARLSRQDARLRHWNALVRSASAQCGRNWIPLCHPPIEWSTFLQRPTEPGFHFVLTPDATNGFFQKPSSIRDVHLLIGPEGGFEEEELEAVRNHGYEPVRLGPRILRTETAPLVGLAVLQALWGDLNNPLALRPTPPA